MGLTLIEKGRFNQSPAASLQDLTTATYFDAEHSRAANNGKRVRLYTPDDFERSSIGPFVRQQRPLGASIEDWDDASALVAGGPWDLAGHRVPHSRCDRYGPGRSHFQHVAECRG